MQKLLDRIYTLISRPLPDAAARALRQFFTVSFVTFLAVGIVNTLSTTAISSLLDFLVEKLTFAQNTLFTRLRVTFILGYALSMLISFFLNCHFTFREKPTLARLIRFPVSYLPNFAIQYVVVWILTNAADAPPTLSYFAAAILAIPATFVVMRIFVFKK